MLLSSSPRITGSDKPEVAAASPIILHDDSPIHFTSPHEEEEIVRNRKGIMNRFIEITMKIQDDFLIKERKKERYQTVPYL